LFAQFTAVLNETQSSNDAAFNLWFSTIQGVLSGDVAGNLLNLINNNADDIAVHTTAISTAISSINQNTSDISENSEAISLIGHSSVNEFRKLRMGGI